MAMLKLHLASWTLLLVFALGAAPVSGAPITSLFSTGVDPSGALLPDYAADPHSTLAVSPGFAVGPAITVGVPDLPVTWAANTAISRWVNPNGVGGFMVDWHPGGSYVYETTFSLAGFDPTSVVIELAWAADDASVPGTDFIMINGIPLPPGGFGSGTGPDPGSYSGLHPKVITAAGSPYFLPGLNTLSFVVGNADTLGDPTLPPYSGPTGVHVAILHTDATIVPEPATGSLLAVGLLLLAARAPRRSS
jgi:hypothetical protein